MPGGITEYRLHKLGDDVADQNMTFLDTGSADGWDADTVVDNWLERAARSAREPHRVQPKGAGLLQAAQDIERFPAR